MLLENGDGMFSAMTGDIREAKVSVSIEVYIFKPDEAGRLFADVMIEAARRGVEVRLLVDDQGGIGRPERGTRGGGSGLQEISSPWEICVLRTEDAPQARDHRREDRLHGGSASTRDGSETLATRPSGTIARSG